jgi:hypothetical protein
MDTERKEHYSTNANIIENYLWLITRYMPDKNIKIKAGDIIRFGRIPFRVTKIRLPTGKELYNQNSDEDDRGRPYQNGENYNSDDDEGPGLIRLPDDGDSDMDAVNSLQRVEDSVRKALNIEE